MIVKKSIHSSHYLLSLEFFDAQTHLHPNFLSAPALSARGSVNWSRSGLSPQPSSERALDADFHNQWPKKRIKTLFSWAEAHSTDHKDGDWSEHTFGKDSGTKHLFLTWVRVDSFSKATHQTYQTVQCHVEQPRAPEAPCRSRTCGVVDLPVQPFRSATTDIWKDMHSQNRKRNSLYHVHFEMTQNC